MCELCAPLSWPPSPRWWLEAIVTPDWPLTYTDGCTSSLLHASPTPTASPAVRLLLAVCVCVCVATRMGGSGRVVWLKGLLLTAAVALLVVVRCETDIDDCASDPCRNNGTCTDRVAGYRCNCTANYTGVDCHVSVSGCEGCSAQVNDR